MPSPYRALALVVLSPLALAACGRGGSVSLELTDAAPSLNTIQSVEVSLGLVEVHSYHSCHNDDAEAAADPERGTWTTVNEKAGTFDLLTLQNDVTTPLGEVDVWGKIDRIRVQIDDKATNQVVLKDGQACALDLSSIDTGMVEISHAFEAIEPSRGLTTVVVDFDINESLDQTGACSFALDPVLKIKRIDTEESE